MSFREEVLLDRQHAIRDRGGWALYALEVARRPELVPILEYRVSRVLRRLGPPGKVLSGVLHLLARVWSGTDIHPHAQIGGGLLIDHGPGVVVGPGVQMGRMCRLYQGATLGQNHGGEPTLGDAVTLSPGAKVLGAVTIGDGATIGANAVVLIDVPAGATAVGVPARAIEPAPLSP